MVFTLQHPSQYKTPQMPATFLVTSFKETIIFSTSDIIHVPKNGKYFNVCAKISNRAHSTVQFEILESTKTSCSLADK